ncbi:MAG: hypothetical protein ACRC8K_22890 [Waterburya sp.]
MPQTKIQGKFYPLTNEVTTKLRRAKLTAAEWRIWSYLVEIEPWGDRYQDIDSLEIMSKCDCSRATFYRAIAKLQKLKIFDIQDKGFSVRNLTGASSLKLSQVEEEGTKLKQADLKNEKVVSKMRLDSQNCESDLKNEKVVSKMRLDSQICENQSPESPPDKEFKSPQTLQTYSDFKKTLSEDEREKFFHFVKEQINNLEKPINDLEAWLASKNAAKQNRWEIYYSNYQEQKIKQSDRTTKQNQGSEKLTPSKMQRAIAEFKKQRRINQPVDESEPEVINSKTYQRQQEELNKLLDNPPEYDKSLAQQHQARIAEIKRQQEEIRRANKEAAAERAKQQNQNPETEDNHEINPENLENE